MYWSDGYYYYNGGFKKSPKEACCNPENLSKLMSNGIAGTVAGTCDNLVEHFTPTPKRVFNNITIIIVILILISIGLLIILKYRK